MDKFFKNLTIAAGITAGALFPGEKLHAQNSGDEMEKVPVPEMMNDYKPQEVFDEYGIQKHPEWLMEHDVDQHPHIIDSDDPQNPENVKTPYFKQLEQLKQIHPDIDPFNYFDKDTFVQDYVQKMDSFSKTADGHRLIDFKNAFFQGKKQFFLNEIEKYTKDPASFKGAMHSFDDLYLNSVFNRGRFGPDELSDYLEFLQAGADKIDTGRVYELPTHEELKEMAEKLWDSKGKSL